MILRSKIKHVNMFILITHISINNINNQSFREYLKRGRCRRHWLRCYQLE